MNTQSHLSLSYEYQENNATYSLFDSIKKEVHGAYAFLHITLTIEIPSQKNIYLIDDLTPNGIQEATIRIVLKKNAKVIYKKYISDTTADQNITNLIIECAEEYATAEAIFCCKALTSENIIITTRQEHNAAKTKSSVTIKAVLDNQAIITSNTLIFVAKNAHQIEAAQTSKNIMLSSQARAIAIPKLEVLADDVSCKHGAAISMIDADALFYLQSRGLTQEASKQIIINSFLQ